MIKAVVFDFDGLILDTETPEFQSFVRLFQEHGAELTMEVWGRCIGTAPGSFDPYVHLEQCLGSAVDKTAARARRRALYEELMQGADARPGVRDYLQRARELGLAVGLASSSPRAWVTGYLNGLGLLDYFDCIRTFDDVERAKPDPELYLKALEGLGVRPDEAVAFEDSPNGALAAKRAGMHCVIVPNEVTRQLSFGDFDMKLESMAARPLGEVLAELNRA